MAGHGGTKVVSFISPDIDFFTRFWEWFQRHEQDIIEAVQRFDHEWLRNQLTPQVQKLLPPEVRPGLNWEIGPGKTRRWQFVLSPIVKTNLKYTEAAVGAAPNLENWEWHAFKPAKTDWSHELEIVNADGKSVTINSADWQYVLKKNASGAPFSILFLSACRVDIDEASRDRAANLVLENIIGEKALLDSFQSVDLLSGGMIPDNVPRSEIGDLRDHLISLGVPL